MLGKEPIGSNWCLTQSNILDGFDIFAVSEIWKSTFNEQLINIPGYTKISFIRPHGKIGGGVAMFVKQTLKISQHISFSVTSF